MSANYMDYLANMPEQIMQVMSFRAENIHVFIPWVIGVVLGYMLYTSAGGAAKKQGVSPYPVWIHCYMITIDIIGTITFIRLAIKYHFWFFILQSFLLPIWIYMEVQSIRAGIKNEEERTFEWGRLVKGPISEKQALFYALGTAAASFCINMFILSYIGGMDNMAVWFAYPFTNYVYAIWTWRFWDARSAQTGKRLYNSVSMQIVITLTCFTSFCPGLSWWWEASPFFHTVWFILGGIGCTAVSCYNWYRCAKLPELAE